MKGGVVCCKEVSFKLLTFVSWVQFLVLPKFILVMPSITAQDYIAQRRLTNGGWVTRIHSVLPRNLYYIEVGQATKWEASKHLEDFYQRASDQTHLINFSLNEDLSLLFIRQQWSSSVKQLINETIGSWPFKIATSFHSKSTITSIKYRSKTIFDA